MATALALLAAMMFALAAALQQRGQFHLARLGLPVEGLASLPRLVLVPAWLAGTAFLLGGYAAQGVALEDGRLVVIQPILVTTIVWALPLGYLLTSQVVTVRQAIGASVVVVGLAMFILVGDPDAGNQNASGAEYAIAIAVICAISAALIVWMHGKGQTALKAAIFGVVAGLLFGLSATFAKPVMTDLDQGIVEALDDWRTYALLGFGFIAFVVQQLSLATGQLAPAMAAVSVANPAISVVLGILLFDERLTRPGWHVLVAACALLAALAGAVMITLANRDTEVPGQEPSEAEPAPA